MPTASLARVLTDGHGTNTEAILLEPLDYQIRRAASPATSDRWRLGDYQSRFGDAMAIGALLDQSLTPADRKTQLARAEQLLTEGWQTMAEDTDPDAEKYKRNALKRLARFYDATAAEWKQKLAELEKQTGATANSLNTPASK